MGAPEDSVAGFVLDFPNEQIPPEIVHQAKRCIMNYCSVALHGAKAPAIDGMVALFEAEGSAPKSSIIGKAARTSAQNAALANGFLGHFDDFDDTHMGGNSIHPTSPIFPSPLAIGEQLPVNGLDLIAAFTIGVEVACRVGTIVEKSRKPGTENWHPTSMFGILGAASGAGRLLRLTKGQMVYALGIAGTQASGLRLSSGSMCKPLHAGKAAQNGLFAALAAQHGINGSQRMLEAPRGIIGVQAQDVDVQTLMGGWGKSWEMTHVGFKPYSCGIVTHGVIDGVLTLRERDGLKPEDVERLDGYTHQPSANLMANRQPATGMEGKFSYYHAMASALVYGKVLPPQFTHEAANNPAVAAIRARTEMGPDPSLARDAAIVKATLKDGRVLTARIDHQTGSPANPMSDAQTERKFRDLAEGALPPAKIDQAVEALWNLDKLNSVADLTRTLTP